MASSGKNFQPSSNICHDKKPQSTLVAASPRVISPKSLKQIIPLKHLGLNGESTGHVASFLVKVVALEAIRRFSQARCPVVWSSIQALQVLAYPPFKFIRRLMPLGFIIKGIQKLSMPLLFLSVTTALGERSPELPDDPRDRTDDPQESSESNGALLPRDSEIADEPSKDIVSESWLVELFKELEKQGITLPERFDEDELRRFYMSAYGDLRVLVSSVKKTIRWRETFHILPMQELQKWSHLVFWHGRDTMLRPCLVIRLGLACSSLPPRDRPRFGQAIVSQIDHGILHLLNSEDRRIAVLLDCQGVSPFRFPMQLLRSFSTVIQENYPDRLAILFVLRLPPVVRVIAQTFIQILRPATRKKLRFEGEAFQNVLAEFLQTVPACLGGKCSCSQCDKKPRNTPDQMAQRSSQAEEFDMDDAPFDTSYLLEDMEFPSPHGCQNMIRAIIVGFLLLCIFIAFLAGMNDSSSFHQIIPSPWT